MLAFTAASTKFGVNKVGIAADINDFLSGEDVNFNGQGRLRATRPGFEDTSRGGAVTGGDVCGDGKGSLRDGLSREEIMLKEQDNSKLGYGFNTGRDVTDTYTEDLRGVVLLQETSGPATSDSIVEGTFNSFFRLGSSSQDGGIADAAGEVDDGGGVRERELEASLLEMDCRLIFEHVGDGDGCGVLDDLRRDCC